MPHSHYYVLLLRQDKWKQCADGGGSGASTDFSSLVPDDHSECLSFCRYIRRRRCSGCIKGTFAQFPDRANQTMIHNGPSDASRRLSIGGFHCGYWPQSHAHVTVILYCVHIRLIRPLSVHLGQETNKHQPVCFDLSIS